jgi:hypothetical protein
VTNNQHHGILRSVLSIRYRDQRRITDERNEEVFAHRGDVQVGGW